MNTDHSSEHTPQAFWFGRLCLGPSCKASERRLTLPPPSPLGSQRDQVEHVVPRLRLGARLGWGLLRILEEVLAAGAAAPVGGASAGPAACRGHGVEEEGRTFDIQLIDDMHAKVTKEAAEESKVFEEYARFCDDEATAKEYAIKDSKEAFEELPATITDSKAIIESEDSKVGDLTTKISDTESELSNVIAGRSRSTTTS